MSKFAKIFETEKYGQILVLRDTNDECLPAVTYSVEPPNLGICSISQVFKDNDDGWDKQEELFEKVDLKIAEMVANEIFKTTAGVTSCTE